MTWGLARGGGALLPHGTRGQRSEWPACRVCVGLVNWGGGAGEGHKYISMFISGVYRNTKPLQRLLRPGSRSLQLDLEGNRSDEPRTHQYRSEAGRKKNKNKNTQSVRSGGRFLRGHRLDRLSLTTLTRPAPLTEPDLAGAVTRTGTPLPTHRLLQKPGARLLTLVPWVRLGQGQRCLVRQELGYRGWGQLLGTWTEHEQGAEGPGYPALPLTGRYPKPLGPPVPCSAKQIGSGGGLKFC